MRIHDRDHTAAHVYAREVKRTRRHSFANNRVFQQCRFTARQYRTALVSTSLFQSARSDTIIIASLYCVHRATRVKPQKLLLLYYRATRKGKTFSGGGTFHTERQYRSVNGTVLPALLKHPAFSLLTSLSPYNVMLIGVLLPTILPRRN